jgi:hypothetical protein
LRLLAVCLVLLTAAPACAAAGDVPEAIQGKWVDKGEACDASSTAAVISATTLVYPDGTIDDVVFTPDDGVMRIREEATAYEYVAADDMLLFRPEGFGMGSAFPMVRCPEPAAATERRCGWLANLTPGDWWLVDAERTWVLSAQGDDNAVTIAVMDRVPGFDPDQFVSTGSYYGYGCACLTVATDSATGRISAIASSKRLPLATCEADASLTALSDW